MENKLALYNNFETIQNASAALYKSGYFADVKSEAQAMVKVMAGQELGLPAFASMTGIHIIQGKPALGSNVIATLVKNDPRYNYRIKICTDKECVLEWFENGEKQGESGFTMTEVIAGNINKNWDKETSTWKEKPTWKAYPSDMLFARAITRGARRFAPGIFGGSPIYTPEELGADVDEDGYIDTSHRIIDEPSTLVNAAVELGGKVKSSMSLESAEAVTNKDGVRYGDIDSDALSNMTIGIGKAMKKSGLMPDKLDEYKMKMDAIQVILESRNGG